MACGSVCHGSFVYLLLLYLISLFLCRGYDSSDVENPGNNLYVTGLSTRVTKRDLEKHFSAEGMVWVLYVLVLFFNFFNFFLQASL